jgi:hypothetical protein
VTVLPPGVVVVPPVDVIAPVSVVAVLGVVPAAVVPAAPVVPVALVARVLGEIAAPHVGVALGLVITTSVTTSWRPAGTVNAVTLPAPGSTVCAIATICSTGGTAVAASADGDDVSAEVVVAMVGVVCAPAAPAPNTTRAATNNLRVLRPIPGPPLVWNCRRGFASRMPSAATRRIEPPTPPS